MTLKFPLLCASVAVALAIPAMSAQACFTVIVGKDVSATGDIMVGHNEDNGQRIMSNQYWVPPATHKAGEMLEYEPTAAKIPQVEKTNGFWWEQTLHPDGYSFSDSFFNDKGVLVTSNNCRGTIEQDEKEVLKDGGIGYGIRRLIAERATSARDGVTIAIELVTKYGYRQAGRTYTIADKNEAWQLALLMGGRYLARKVQNNEVTVMSNAFSLGPVDLKDKENIIASPDLIENAIKKGTYKPAKEGDYSDFNFRKAYNLKERLELDTNIERIRAAIFHLTGFDYKQPYDQDEAMAIHPHHKLSVADVRDILRLNNPWERRETGWHHEKMYDPSNLGTFDSAVYVMTQNPLLSYTWRTSGRPDSQFSYPQFMLGKPANTQSYLTPEAALMAQFHSAPEDFNYDPNRSVFTFVNLQNFLDWDDQAFRRFPITQRAFEAEAARDFRIAMTRARELAPMDTDKTIEAMHEFNVQSFDRALGATSSELARLNRYTIFIEKKELQQGSPDTVKVALFSTRTFDATKVDEKKTYFGDGYPEDSIDLSMGRATPTKVEFVDVNGDGLKDAVFEFPIKGATYNTFPGVVTQLYLWTYLHDRPIMAFDTVKIVK